MRSDELPFRHPWAQGLLATYADVIVGGTPSTEIAAFWGGDIKWMASGDIHRRHIFDVPGRISQRGLAASNAVVVSPKAVAIALAGQGKTRGTVALTHVPICTNQSVALIKPKDGRLDAEYLYQSLIPRYEEMRSRSAGGGRAGLTKAIIEHTPIQVPSPGEQAAIAEVLSTVDEAIDQTEALIAKTQQIKAGLMHDLFTRGVTPDGRLRPPRDEAPKFYKESPLGWIPKEWEVSNAASEFDITSGITLGPHRRPTRNPHPYLRVANVYAERLDLQDVAFLEAGADVPGKTLAGDDLLVVEGHANPEEIGRCALATSEVEGFTFQNHLFRLRARRIMPAFAVRWLNCRVVRAYWLRTCSTSSGLNTINRAKLGAVPAVVPSPIEQRMLCAILDEVSGKIAASSGDCAKLRQLKAGLMHDLLTGRVRVAEAQKAAANV